MSRLPSLKRLAADQFSELKWFPKFAGILNPFIEQVSSALDKRLTITDNFDGEIITFQTDGTYPIELPWSRASIPATVIVGNCYKTTGTTPTFTSAPYCQWRFDSGKIVIDNITGITPTAVNRYTLVIECKVG